MTRIEGLTILLIRSVSFPCAYELNRSLKKSVCYKLDSNNNNDNIAPICKKNGNIIWKSDEKIVKLVGFFRTANSYKTLEYIESIAISS